MFRSSAIRFKQLTAGLVTCCNRVAVSFLSLPESKVPVASYIGDFKEFHSGNMTIHIPIDMPSELKKGHRLMALFDQLPELADTKCVAISSDEIFVGEWAFERFLKAKGIEVQSINSSIYDLPRFVSSDEALIEMTCMTAMALQRQKEVDKWLKTRGYE
jgi:hypothetical protein